MCTDAGDLQNWRLTELEVKIEQLKRSTAKEGAKIDVRRADVGVVGEFVRKSMSSTVTKAGFVM